MTERIQVTMQEAKCQLTQLAERVSQGETVVIIKDGSPYVVLVPHAQTLPAREPGRLKGKIWMSSDFDKTQEDIIDGFGGCL